MGSCLLTQPLLASLGGFMLTSGLGASEKNISLKYLNVDKKHENVKPKLFCH